MPNRCQNRNLSNSVPQPLPFLEEELARWDNRHREDEKEYRVNVDNEPVWIDTACQSISKQYRLSFIQVQACCLQLGLRRLERDSRIRRMKSRYSHLIQDLSIVELNQYSEQPFWSWSCLESTLTINRRLRIPVDKWITGQLSELTPVLHTSKSKLANVAILLGLSKSNPGLFRDDFSQLARRETSDFARWLREQV